MFDHFIFDSGKFDRETNDKYEGRIYGDGQLICNPEFVYSINTFTLYGKSSLFGLLAFGVIIQDSKGEIIEGESEQNGNGGLELTLVMVTDINFVGTGILDIFNFGDIITDVLYLREISLLPNQTITIDTDSMTVLFGVEHDVSSLTNESTFFVLNEGNNELKFEITYEIPPNPMPENELETTIIWQNRWL